MSESQVPIIPGMISSEADVSRLSAAADEIGYPVIVKAAAGGGGKGMRIVRAPEELAHAVELAKSEALNAFGDATVYLEKCLDRPKHVEFQILADTRGNVVHVFERECSIQRRHQKIVEETPSPAVDNDLREKMGAAAVAAARAAGYVNAGTVEFLLDSSGRFYFLEVNTRLQVEHPVTEMTTGLDLVRAQFEIAAGEPLRFGQQDLTRRGHAIECRIYAENPEADFMPSPGKILFVRIPEGPGVRFDHGIQTGYQVPVNYDPILGKLVVWAEDRPAAVKRMIRSLRECVILGVKTPIEFLIEVLSSPEFKAGNTHTCFIRDYCAAWEPDRKEDPLAAMGFVAHEMVTRAVATSPDEPLLKSGRQSPWHTLGSWDSAR
jgi:acetyl/propionyl-CoA carboxylase alpha subunit